MGKITYSRFNCKDCNSYQEDCNKCKLGKEIFQNFKISGANVSVSNTCSDKIKRE